jgi:hypothetical protein
MSFDYTQEQSLDKNILERSHTDRSDKLHAASTLCHIYLEIHVSPNSDVGKTENWTELFSFLTLINVGVVARCASPSYEWLLSV